MIQPSLFDYKPPAPQSILGDRDGSTFDPKRDLKPLNKQAQAVWDAMVDGKWHTLAELSKATGYGECSVSARTRDFRKEEFGCVPETMESEILFGRTWHYRLHPEKRLA